jgi:hypothetical protein
MPSPRQTKEPQQPTFVFKGTIKKLKSATMKDVPLNDRTAIVTVDQIIETPPDLAGYGGQDITVQLSGRQKVRVGQQMLFHATGWMFGDGVAVRSLQQEPLKNGQATSVGAGDDAVERRGQKQQRSRFKDADLVVSGKVVAVRLPGDSTPGRKGAGRQTDPITEHDPKWREAIIQVDEVLKGTHQKKRVVVRFPASSDVMWHEAPKLEAGQQGYFTLHKSESKKPTTKDPKKPSGKSRGAEADKADRNAAEYYLARDSADFRPYGEGDGVKPLLETESIKRK